VLIKLVQERWAADRFIAPEIWRCAVPCANAEGVAVILQALNGKARKAEIEAIAKVCMSHPQLCDPQVIAAVKNKHTSADPAKLAWSEFAGPSYE